jgi:hypothetical protein
MHAYLIKPLHHRALSSLVALAACTSLALASEDTDRRVSDALQAAVARLVENGEIPLDALQDLHLQLDAFNTVRFGALVEGRFDSDSDLLGLKVLAVASDSPAQKMGLQPGDHIQSVAGASLVGLGALDAQQARAAVVFKQVLSAQNGDVELLVQRNGSALALHTTVNALSLPGMQVSFAAAATSHGGGGSGGGRDVDTCGRISQLFVGSRSRAEFPLVIIEIDGKVPGPTRADTFRVAPGLRRVTVAEAIDPREFSDVALARRSRDGSAFRHDIQIDVDAGVTYRLAARFNGQVGMLRDNSYWQPVVVSEKAEGCR